jgi:hypothetical protein
MPGGSIPYICFYWHFLRYTIFIEKGFTMLRIPTVYLETTIFNFPFADDAPQYKAARTGGSVPSCGMDAARQRGAETVCGNKSGEVPPIRV